MGKKQNRAAKQRDNRKRREGDMTRLSQLSRWKWGWMGTRVVRRGKREAMTCWPVKTRSDAGNAGADQQFQHSARYAVARAAHPRARNETKKVSI